MAGAKKKIVWAIDPFSDLKADYAKVAKLLNFIGGADKAKVEPVYVLSPDGFNWSGEFTGQWFEKYLPLVEQAYEKLAPSLQLREPLPFKILANKQASLKSDVKKLVEFAKRGEARLLVIQTHGRKGLNRFVLGSFAETTIMNAKSPLLLLNHESAVPAEFKKIFFPTDLSSASKKAFKTVVAWAKQWGAEVVIFHKLPDPIEPLVQSGVYMAGGGWVSLYQFMDKESGARRKACEELAAQAKKAGVATSLIIEDKPGFVAESVKEHAARTQAQVIAMASHTGPIASVLIGSVARELARDAKIPLLIFHSK